MGAHLLLFLALNSHYFYLFCFELLVITGVWSLYEEYIFDCLRWLFLQAGHVNLRLVVIRRHRCSWCIGLFRLGSLYVTFLIDGEATTIFNTLKEHPGASSYLHYMITEEPE